MGCCGAPSGAGPLGLPAAPASPTARQHLRLRVGHPAGSPCSSVLNLLLRAVLKRAGLRVRAAFALSPGTGRDAPVKTGTLWSPSRQVACVWGPSC